MKFLEWQANLVRKWFSPRRQMLVGILMVDLSIVPFAVYYPFSGEKFGVYWMSQLTMLVGGIVMVAEAALAEKEQRKKK